MKFWGGVDWLPDLYRRDFFVDWFWASAFSKLSMARFRFFGGKKIATLIGPIVVHVCYFECDQIVKAVDPTVSTVHETLQNASDYSS